MTVGEPPTSLHELLDDRYGPDGDRVLRRLLEDGADPEERRGPLRETALHVAARRRRIQAIAILVDHGVDLDARNAGGKSAWAHARRRGFTEIAELLASSGSDTTVGAPDRLAVALSAGRLDEARSILAAEPGCARTGNPEEDRLLADLAGRPDTRPVELLIEAGADLEARALDDGTALHQAAWFGQSANARLLVCAGAPLDVFDRVHGSSPLGWAAHGSRHSGGAEQRQASYVELAELLLEAGSPLDAPGDVDGASRRRLRRDASAAVLAVLDRHARA